MCPAVSTALGRDPWHWPWASVPSTRPGGQAAGNQRAAVAPEGSGGNGDTVPTGQGGGLCCAAGGPELRRECFITEGHDLEAVKGLHAALDVSRGQPQRAFSGHRRV